MIEKKTGFAHFVAAFGYSMQGLRAVWQESAFRQETVLLLIALPCAIWLGRTALEIVALIGCLLLVLIVELINSAIESVVDRIGTELHPLAGRAKDIGSAAVFVALVHACFVWFVIALFRFVL